MEHGKAKNSIGLEGAIMTATVKTDDAQHRSCGEPGMPRNGGWFAMSHDKRAAERDEPRFEILGEEDGEY